jgi:hypothetical protein
MTWFVVTLLALGLGTLLLAYELVRRAGRHADRELAGMVRELQAELRLEAAARQELQALIEI